MSHSLASLVLRYERDIVLARQKARQIAARLGFDGQDQSRLSTAVSEIARNAFTYGNGGTVEFLLEGRTAPQVLTVRVADRGPGISDLPAILGGRFRSDSGMGLGIVGARRLVDQFDIESAEASGTTIELSLEKATEAFEKDVLQDALKSARGNRAKAARLLSTTGRVFNYKVRKYRIDWKRFKG